MIAVLSPTPRTDFPSVTGADDATRAAWVRADNYNALISHLDAMEGRVFSAHAEMLQTFLDSPSNH
ncbi:hypothetical protein [Micrococcus luteus]|uniref:hypothetical protein n=1 Tax=Micrococcus luteus TaxID=1270 RepID=UPI00332C1DBD